MAKSAWGLDRDVDWRQQAACSPQTADWFWFNNSRHGGGALSVNNKAALGLCAQCPVRQRCYNDALDNPESEGRIAGGVVWAGATVRQAVGLPANDYERQQRRRATWREASRRKYAGKREATA
jgi:Transcription factor WhiB